MQRGISVIICCYNSSWIIQRTLEGLKRQNVPTDLSWEIVLVNNNCTDDTVSVATETMKESNLDFTIVEEKKSGLSNARRKGIDTVRYDIVLYCDDDNVLCQDYVITMYRIMRSDSSIGAAGGKGIAEFMQEPESEVLKHLKLYAVGSQLDGRKDWLYGAGLTLRTELVKDVYYKQKCYLIGHKENQLLSGDDSELVMSMVNRGYRIKATDDVFYIHVLKADRLTNEYYEKLHEGIMLPHVVFESMNAAMYGTGFKKIAKKYAILWLVYVKYCIIRWKPWSAEQRMILMKELRRYNYWNIFTLYRIYLEWKKINKLYHSGSKNFNCYNKLQQCSRTETYN